MGRLARLACLAVLSLVGLSGQSLLSQPEVKVTPSGMPASPPSMVWVQDFEIDAPPPADESGGLPGPAGRLLERVREGPTDPATRREQLVNEMASSIVRDVQQAGWPASRISPGAALPTSGWLVRGVFTELSTGNQMQRGIIGLGAGKSELELHVTVDDLAKGAPRPIYTLDASESSGKGPGAGAMVKMNPYAAAAKFVISRKEPERDVAKTASAIARIIVGEGADAREAAATGVDPDAPPPPPAAD